MRVFGCLSDYRWCDVSYGPNRGWVYAGFLSYTYQNRPVVIYQSGSVIGFPIITFSIGTYWDTYYRGRPGTGTAQGITTGGHHRRVPIVRRHPCRARLRGQ